MQQKQMTEKDIKYIVDLYMGRLPKCKKIKKSTINKIMKDINSRSKKKWIKKKD